MVAVEHPGASPATTTAEGPGRVGNAHARLGLALVVTGILAVTAALLGLVSRQLPARARPVAIVSTAVRENGVTVREAVYEPGASSRWHRHSGTHVITVLACVLTVYEADCHARFYRAGETFIGGQEPHLAKNEGGEEARMVITTVYDASASSQATFVTPVPAPCQVS